MKVKIYCFFRVYRIFIIVRKFSKNTYYRFCGDFYFCLINLYRFVMTSHYYKNCKISRE